MRYNNVVKDRVKVDVIYSLIRVLYIVVLFTRVVYGDTIPYRRLIAPRSYVFGGRTPVMLYTIPIQTYLYVTRINKRSIMSNYDLENVGLSL